MSKIIKTALIQLSSTGDKQTNLDKTISKIQEARTLGADMVILQELFLTDYFCQEENTDFFALAEPLNGRTSQILAEVAKQNEVVIVASLFEFRAAGLYHNTTQVYDKDGSVAGLYRKMHIPDDPGFYEKFYFTPGDIGFSPIDTSLGKLGVLICWDQWFPEAARLMALSGAEILIYPTAIGWNPNDPEDEKARQIDAWVNIQRSHAIANGLPVIAVNRTGFEKPGIHFWGSSFACGPQGEILAQAPINQEDLVMVEINLERSREVRNIWPYFRDRRVDHYFDLTKIWND